MHRLAPFVLCILVAAVLAAGCGGKSYDPSLQMPNFNYGEILDGDMQRAKLAMSKVRDMASAKAAAKEIGLINQDLDDLVYNAPRLSDDGQIALSQLAREHLVEVQSLKMDIDQSPVLAEVFDENLTEMMRLLQVIVKSDYQDRPEG